MKKERKRMLCSLKEHKRTMRSECKRTGCLTPPSGRLFNQLEKEPPHMREQPNPALGSVSHLSTVA